MKSNKTIALISVKGFPDALGWVSEKLKRDEDVVLVAVRGNYASHQYMSKKMYGNVNVVTALVEQCGSLLQHAHPSIKTKKTTHKNNESSVGIVRIIFIVGSE